MDPLDHLPEPAAPHIDTPLGAVRLLAMVDGKPVDSPAEIEVLLSGERIVRWNTDSFHLELSISHPPVELYADIEIPEYVAGIWCMTAKDEAIRPAFLAEWAPGWTWNEAGSAYGQFLQAWEWSRSNTMVTIGTADEEWLLKRCVVADEIPDDWRPELERRSDYHYPATALDEADLQYRMLGRAIVIETPELAPHSACRIQFAIAWTSGPDIDGCSRAVDYVIMTNLAGLL